MIDGIVVVGGAAFVEDADHLKEHVIDANGLTERIGIFAKEVVGGGRADDGDLRALVVFVLGEEAACGDGAAFH